MQYRIVNLIISSILLFALISCGDNSINNPVANESINKMSSSGERTLDGTLILDYRLADPIKVNQYYLLDGEVNYTQQITRVQNPLVASPDYEVVLDIEMAAKLRDNTSPVEPDPGHIKAKSRDQIKLDGNSDRKTLIKTYSVKGISPKILELNCTFIVTTEGVFLDKVTLRSPVV